MDPDDEMLQGYLDGLRSDSPAPSDNRSHSYQHGFANGRDDLVHHPRAPAADLREMAEMAIALDGMR